jgi:6-phosphogluconolactonase
VKPPDPTATPFEIVVLPDSKALAETGAREFARAAIEAISERGKFRVALAGGSTPRAMYQRLTRVPYRSSVPWERVRFFWGDERCVPPDSERSNYRMARETLLEPLGIAPEHVFRMKGEEAPARAAREYERVLRREFRGRPARVDLIFLGLGPDGHLASLFPGTTALAEDRRLVAANSVARFSEWRLTLTYRAINAARRIVFLVSGVEKAAPLATILRKRRGWQSLPASRVAPRRGSLLWLVDKAAASKL